MKNSPVRGWRRSSPAAGVDALSPISAWGACAACAVCAACVVSAACDTADCCHRRCSSSRGPDSSRNHRPSPLASPSPLHTETRTGRRPLDFRRSFPSSRHRRDPRTFACVAERKIFTRRRDVPRATLLRWLNFLQPRAIKKSPSPGSSCKGIEEKKIAKWTVRANFENELLANVRKEY